jgi:hypothetical protein
LVNGNEKRALSFKVAICFIIFGAVTLGSSYVLSSQILTLTGLGLTFWGALFLLIAPVIHIEGSVVVNMTSSSYMSTERMVKQMDCKGKGFHLPPYPNEGYIPEHLKGLGEMVVFIPKEEQSNHIPSLQELAEGKFILKNPEGLLLTPPGLGLLSSIEQALRVDFTKAKIDEVCKIMPKAITGNYSLAKELSMIAKDDKVNVRVKGSIFKNLYLEQNKTCSVSTLGCPIVSSIACSLAKSSGKAVMIEKINPTPDGTVIDAQLQLF